jgi:hypothetical protein
MARQVIMALTEVSNNPKNIDAVKYELTATIATGPHKDDTSSVSKVIYFIIITRDMQFPTVKATFPKNMNTTARNLAKANFKRCLILKRKPSHAPIQKLPPETAM